MNVDLCIDFRPIRIAMKCGVKNTSGCLAVDGVKIRSKRISKSEKSLNTNDTIKQRVRTAAVLVHFSFFVPLDMQMDSPDPSNVITERYVDTRQRSIGKRPRTIYVSLVFLVQNSSNVWTMLFPPINLSTW